MIYLERNLVFTVDCPKRPVSKASLLTAASSGKEPTHMRQHVESVQQSAQEVQDKQKPLWYRKLVAGTAAAAFALTGCSAAGASSERPAPVVTTTSAPEGVNPRTGCLIDPPSEVPRSHEELVAELEIPAGLEPEEYAQEYLNRLEQWYMSGATEEACNNFYDFSKTTEVRRGELLSEAREDSKIFADALYVPDWEQRDDLQYAYKSRPETSAVMAEWWIKNHRDGTEDFQFKINYGSTDVLVDDGDGNFIIAISGTQDTNWEAMENDVTNIKALDEVSFDIKLSVQTQEDGTMKIANLGAGIPATQQ